LQAQVETQLRAEREKHKRELEEAAGLLAELERAKQEAEARRQAAEEQAAKLKSAEEDTRTQISAEQRAELEAERQRILAEAEQANAQLREARTAMEQAAMNRQLAERRSSQLAEAEQEAARLKEQARKSMEQASGEVGRLEQELAEARQLAEEQLQKSREAEEARVAAERLASDAQTQLETARQVAETYREREKLDREIRVDQKRKSSLPLVLGVIAVALIGGGAFLLKDKFLKPSSAPEAPATATTAPEAERPVTIDQLPSARPEPTPGAPAVIAPPAFEPLSLLRDKLANGTSAPRLIVIPAGSFEMGSADGATDEQPVHEVTLQAFAIGQYEVSFAEFDAFVRDTGRTRPDDNWGRGSNPVINVSWNDAVAYTEWLSKQTKQVYRLPTEAEWEYAARGGTTGAIWWNLYDEKVYARCSDCDFRTPNPDRPLAVESLLPNPYKLHHVSGNVMEWVADCYQSGYSGAPSDGSARGGRSCAKRVLRGGSFLNRMSEVRPAARSSLAPDAASFEIGFRVVRELER
ncbi:MAG TPA: SUMF1/EgtB/PvdO family nonheme iron enzyme, partial [Gammaproteobacteria bacterium]